ncbi:regulatory protein RecX [Coprobacter tertius]|uniref:Regulatory protein RecX n=1 Tax=Coprobacter tertius TaxID=2944915 RepID=A0ABT1MKD1_9BACT|nr:regulatory protein RecX [Coprobacter tertius]MCP9613077.1 RecX family transcriptional regulator [Coprobacter tertius]
MRKMTSDEALHRLAALCSTSEQCESDLRSKLSRWEIDTHDQDSIIVRLRKERFFDEIRYCRGFANDKFKFNKWGKIKIAYALKQKGINDTYIKEALENIDDKAYCNLLSDILILKKKEYRGNDIYTQKAKLFRFAASRGFETEIINNILKKILS